MVEDLEQTPEGRLHRNRHGPIPRATDREISCPSAGKSESAYREVGMSASTMTLAQIIPTLWIALGLEYYLPANPEISWVWLDVKEGSAL